MSILSYCAFIVTYVQLVYINILDYAESKINFFSSKSQYHEIIHVQQNINGSLVRNFVDENCEENATRTQDDDSSSGFRFWVEVRPVFYCT
jgi:hypothetical protein